MAGGRFRLSACSLYWTSGERSATLKGAMANGNPFFGLSLVQLQELQGLYVQVLKDIALAGQSYSFPGRSFTRADIPNVKELLSDINGAMTAITGVSVGRQFAQATIDTQRRFAG